MAKQRARYVAWVVDGAETAVELERSPISQDPDFLDKKASCRFVSHSSLLGLFRFFFPPSSGFLEESREDSGWDWMPVSLKEIVVR